MKSFIKAKTNPANLGPGFRTSDHFKSSRFSPGKMRVPQAKFNPAQFKTQHKG